jgi:hypothetical protein
MRKRKNTVTSLPQPTDHLLTVGQAADVLQCSTSSLNKWRTWGRGPRFIKVERRVRYRSADLATYIENQTRSSTSSTAT